MPRPKKRPKQIKISVSTAFYDDITRMAELSEMSISGCLADMLEALHPGIKHTLFMLEESHKLDAQAKNNLVKTLEQHERHLMQVVEHVKEDSVNEVKQHKLPL